MDADAKKTALRMIPYGLYVLTAEKDGEIAAATVNWVTQTAFDPPLVVVGVKADASAHDIIKKAGSFALNILGKGQQGPAFAFFKPVEKDATRARCPQAVLRSGARRASVCRVLVKQTVDGDHSIFVGKVVNAAVQKQPEGRADGDAAHGRLGRQGLLRRLKESC